jgi:hypothetical protein
MIANTAYTKFYFQTKDGHVRNHDIRRNYDGVVMDEMLEFRHDKKISKVFVQERSEIN